MTESARARGMADVEQAERLNRSIRTACWGLTQAAMAAAFQARGGRALKLPAMDSSETCAACGHIDAASRKGKRFACTACAHRADPDVNAAQVMRQRAVRWLALSRNGRHRRPSAPSALEGAESRTRPGARQRHRTRRGDNQARVRTVRPRQRRRGCAVGSRRRTRAAGSAGPGPPDAQRRSALRRRRTRRQARRTVSLRPTPRAPPSIASRKRNLDSSFSKGPPRMPHPTSALNSNPLTELRRTGPRTRRARDKNSTIPFSGDPLESLERNNSVIDIPSRASLRQYPPERQLRVATAPKNASKRPDLSTFWC